MSGIYQKQVNSGTVASPSAGRTLISVNDSGELFTKDSSGNVSITQPKFVTVETAHSVDIESLLAAISADPFDVELWKASFSVSFYDGTVLSGIYETVGDFSTEVSYSGIIGLSPSDDETYKELLITSALFKPTGGEQLGGIQMSHNIKIGGFQNIEITYRYEENPDATGSDGKYLHSFKIIIETNTILGYVEIYADDTESHQFIFDGIS